VKEFTGAPLSWRRGGSEKGSCLRRISEEYLSSFWGGLERKDDSTRSMVIAGGGGLLSVDAPSSLLEKVFSPKKGPVKGSLVKLGKGKLEQNLRPASRM